MSNLNTPPRAIFTQIQANLKDRYASGFPVLKELIQNAEDAKAGVIRFVAREGWPEAENPLLRVPGLLVCNDGGFRESDGLGILSFADSAKGDDSGAIGRFGFGQKAVFHLCDAFIVHAFGHSAAFSEVVNPCLGVIETTQAEAWDAIGPGDGARLQAACSGVDRGLLVWLPLRRDDILPAPKLTFVDNRPRLEELIAGFDENRAELHLTLAGLRHLNRIELWRGDAQLFGIAREPEAPRMVGPNPDGDLRPVSFESKITDHAGNVSAYVGREVSGAHERLDSLRKSERWPQSPIFTETGEEIVPEKAEVHAAVVITSQAAEGDTLVDWAVFLPVGRAACFQLSRARVRLLLHGYFFVDSGRRYIEGFDAPETAAATVQAEWNVLLRDKVLLPLFPAAIFDAFSAGMLTDEELADLLRGIESSPFGCTHRRAMTERHVVARVLEDAGGKFVAPWQLLPAESELRWVPTADERGRFRLADILPTMPDWAQRRGLSLAVRPAALTASDPRWQPEEVEDLIGALSHRVFLQGGRAAVLAELLGVIVGEAESLRQAAAPGILSLLRRALLEDTSLANESDLRAILEFLPADQVVGLPRSAGRSRRLLRSLAEAREAPLCLSEDILTAEVLRSQLDPVEAASLLQRNAPLLERGGDHEAAGAAALRIVTLLGAQLAAFLGDPTFRRLNILRAQDGSGVSALVSLDDLLVASRAQRLFRQSPQAQQALKALCEAAPGREPLMLRRAEADLLVPVDQQFRFSDATAENVARLILVDGVFGPLDARARYLHKHFTDVSQARRAMRSMAAGKVVDDAVRLYALAEGMGPLATLAEEMIAEDSGALLIAPEILSALNRKQSAHLGISEIRGRELGEVLHRNIETLNACTLTDQTVLALLKSDVPDDLLKDLPIFPSRAGHSWVASEIWSVRDGFAVPPSLSRHVPVLRRLNHAESDARMERLVELWTPKALIDVALDQLEPHAFANDILKALRLAGSIECSRIRTTCWLLDQTGRAWAPNDVLDLTPEVSTAARKTLAKDGALPFVAIDELAPEQYTRNAPELLRKHRIVPDSNGSLDHLLQHVERLRPVAVVGSCGNVAQELKVLAKNGVNLSLHGWPLLAALLRCHDAPAEQLVAAFGTVRRGDTGLAARYLTALERPIDDPKLQGASWKVYGAAVRELGNWPEAARQEVFASCRVRTAADSWASGKTVAHSGGGILPGHLLHPELRSYLPQALTHLDAPETQQRAMGQDDDERDPDRLLMRSAQSLKPILDFASQRVPDELLLLLVGLVGRTDAFRNVILQSLQVTDVDITRTWGRIDSDVAKLFVSETFGQKFEDKRASRIVEFVPMATSPSEVTTETLAGKRASLPTGDVRPLGIVGNLRTGWRNFPHKSRNIGALRAQIAIYGQDQLTSAEVKTLCMTLADVFIGGRADQGACLNALDRLADECDKVDQATVDAARAELEDRLPQVLDELKPTKGSELWTARNSYRRKIEGQPAGNGREKIRPIAKHDLWEKVAQPGASGELLAAVRTRIEDYGYDPSRVLFELFQNADDAARQHPNSHPARFRLTVDGESIVAAHWGRLINHPGPDVEEGIKLGWRNDLFNMLVMNLSEKGEDVTGRFGLGFKSVHLISGRVSIASHFVGCHVIGGMLPEAWPEGRGQSVDAAENGRPATVINLEIDPKRRKDAQQAFDAFSSVAMWLPAMTQSVRHIEIAHVGDFTVEFVDTEAPGVRLVSFGGRDTGNAVALDLGQEATLFLPLGAQGPVAAPKGIPRLWLLAPLSETLSSGWLLNSRDFRVDPGRGRLAGTEAEREEIFAGFGRMLGHRLVALFDLVTEHWSSFADRAGFTDVSDNLGRSSFLRYLDDMFASDQSDPLASHLHSMDRGFGQLIVERAALATGLPSPFSPFLRADDVRCVMAGAISDPAVLASLHDWKAIQTIGGAAVAERVANRIEALGFDGHRRFTLVDLLRQEIGTERRVAPELAQRLGQLVNEDFVKSLDKAEEGDLLEYLGSLLFRMSDGQWHTAALPPRAAPEGEEENRILPFAPPKYLADKDYGGPALFLYRLAMRQSGFQRGEHALAQWAALASGKAQQRAVVSYVLEGRQGTQVGDLIAAKRPSWLPESSEKFRASALGQSVASEDLPRLLGILFPAEQRMLWTGGPSIGLDDFVNVPANPQDFLRGLYGWWQDNHETERKAYDQRVYPHGFYPNQLVGEDGESQPEGWFTFFALAIFRTLGRAPDGAHRNFIANARRDGWWQDMATARLPDDPAPWLRNLEDFARPDAWRIDYPQWRRALTDLYVLARWLPDYVDAYRHLPGIVRKYDGIALKEVWRLSATPLWGRRGLEGAPLTQSLGLGANWLIREGMRNGLWDEGDKRLLAPYGWGTSRRLRTLCQEELDLDLGYTSDMDRSREVYETVHEYLADDACFLGDLDLPMQLITLKAHREDLERISSRGHSFADTNGYYDETEEDYDEA